MILEALRRQSQPMLKNLFPKLERGGLKKLGLEESDVVKVKCCSYVLSLSYVSTFTTGH